MINIIGNILGTSGYDVHTRQLANALNKITEVRLDSLIPSNMANQLNDQEVKMIKREPKDDQINLIITNPMHWRLNVGMGRNWAYLIFEGSKMPKSWVSECRNLDIEYIFVPSNHTKQAIYNAIKENPIDDGKFYDWEKKIKIIHHGVDLNIFKPLENSPQSRSNSVQSEEGQSIGVSTKKSMPLGNIEGSAGKHGLSSHEQGLTSSVDTFRFLCNKGFRNLEDRGGIQYALRAYMEEFTDKDNVELIVKLNPAYGIPDVNRLTEQLLPRKENLPKIRFDITNYKYEDLVKLYNQADVFVSPTRAEAFNIPCIEAMACGLPVITTNFGGQTDFVDDTNGWVIGGELKPVEHELLYEETQWLTPDISELKKQMRRAYATREEVKEKGKKALETAKKFTWDKSAEKIKELI